MNAPNSRNVRQTGALTGLLRLPRVKLPIVAMLAALLPIVIPGCVGGGRSLPTAAQLITASPPDRRTPPVEQLARGRNLYMSSCTECHSVYYPSEFVPAAWTKLVADMRTRSNLTEAEAADVTAYLVTASQATRVPAGGSPAVAP